MGVHGILRRGAFRSFAWLAATNGKHKGAGDDDKDVLRHDDQSNGHMERLGSDGTPRDQQEGVERMAREQYWPSTLMAVGLFAFIATFWAGQAITFITFGEIFRWLALFSFAGNLLPYMRSGLVLGMERLEWFLFNLLAVGPLVFTALLWGNFLLRDEPEAYLLQGNFSRADVLSHWHAHRELPPARRLDEVLSQASPEERAKGYVMGPLLKVSQGALGYAVIDDWQTSVLVRLEDLH